MGRVVVVEDEAAVREAVLTGPRQEGFVTTGFADAVDAELILAGSPDLAVLDIALPGANGFALARALPARSTLSITLSKDQLLSQVWGYDAYDSNLVEVHVSALRRKLKRTRPRVVRGIGYRLAP